MGAEKKKWILESDQADKPDYMEIYDEITFLNKVCEGELDLVQEEISSRRPADALGGKNLSDNHVQGLKYKVIMNIGVISRACISKGLNAELSFQMSDFYVRLLDRETTIKGVENVCTRMLIDYTGKMKRLSGYNSKTRAVNESLAYIAKHLSESITLNDVSEAVGISPSYLSRQFSKEVGESISDFIRERKLERAEVLLRYSDMSYTEIAIELGFSSQSHFIRKFKEYSGSTPKQYREENYLKDWGALSIDGYPQEYIRRDYSIKES